MLTVLVVLSIDFIAGLVLFSFINPVTRSSYEERTGIPIDVAETLQQRGEPE